jgi:hypothetical protein
MPLGAYVEMDGLRAKLASAEARNTQILRDFHAEIHDGQSESAHDVIQRLVREKQEAQAQSEQYRLETHRWADAAKKDREERDGLWKKICDAQARAEKAEASLKQSKELHDFFLERSRSLEASLDLARKDIQIRQARAERAEGANSKLRWALESQPCTCLDGDPCVRCVGLSEWKIDLTPAPQGRTDGERLDWMEKRTLFFHWFGGYKEVILQDYNGNKKFPSIRAAIDAAMDATAPEVKGGAA